MSANPIYQPIEGSPYQPNEKVVVLDSEDETFDLQYLHKVGTVIYLEYECGCGQTYPHDPMIGVLFSNGNTAEFWKEELQRIQHGN